MVEATTRHRQIKEVQGQIIRALCNVAEHGPEYARAVVDANVVEITLTVARTHFDDLPVQLYACILLRVLTYYDADRACPILVEAQGVLFVCQCMERFPTCAPFQAQACALLTNVAYIGELGAQAFAAGAAHVVLRTLSRLRDAAVYEEGCTVLQNLSKAPAGAAFIAFAGGIDIALDALAKFPSNITVLEGACGILRNASVYVPESLYLQALEAVVKAMRDAPSSDSVQEHGCVALSRCASQHPAVVADARCIELVIRAMERLPSYDVQCSGLPLLRFAAERDAACATLVVNAHPIILTAMQLHPTQASVQIDACRLLRCLSLDASFRRTLVKGNFVSEIEKCNNNISVQRARRLALHALRAPTTAARDLLQLR